MKQFPCWLVAPLLKIDDSGFFNQPPCVDIKGYTVQAPQKNRQYSIFVIFNAYLILFFEVDLDPGVHFDVLMMYLLV